MKKIIILAAIFSSSTFAASAQQGFANPREATNSFNKDGLKEGKWLLLENENMDVITDTFSAAYYCLANYRNGKLAGRIRHYKMADSTLAVEHLYHEGKLFETRTYHTNGRLYIETPYSDGKKSGITKTYYENGVLMSETPYTNGQKNGLEKWYHDNGRIKCETIYVNGKKRGPEKWYEARTDY